MSSEFLIHLPPVQKLEEDGYLIVNVTDKVLASIDSIFALGRAFFRGCKVAKQQDSIPDVNEGWKDLGGEFSVAPERPDLHESFWVTQKQCELASVRYSPVGLKLYWEMFKCISMLNNIERTITTALINYVAADRGAEAEFYCDHDSDMQILYYQPSTHTRELLQDPHDDGLYLTFAKADRPGLEILTAEGEYQPIVLDRNQVVVMPGEILSLISGRRISPLIHRVVRHPEQSERLALGYFMLPNIKADSTLRPWISNESNENVDIMQRIIRNQNQFLVP